MTVQAAGTRAPGRYRTTRGRLGAVLLLAGIGIGSAAHGQVPAPMPDATPAATPAPHAAASAAFRQLARDLTGDWSVSGLAAPAHDGHHHHGAGQAVILPTGRDRLRLRLQARIDDVAYRIDAEIVAEADGTYRIHWRDDTPRPDWSARGRHDPESGAYVFAAEAPSDARLTLSAPAPGRVDLVHSGGSGTAGGTASSPVRLVLTRQD